MSGGGECHCPVVAEKIKTAVPHGGIQVVFQMVFRIERKLSFQQTDEAVLHQVFSFVRVFDIARRKKTECSIIFPKAPLYFTFISAHLPKKLKRIPNYDVIKIGFFVYKFKYQDHRIRYDLFRILNNKNIGITIYNQIEIFRKRILTKNQFWIQSKKTKQS